MSLRCLFILELMKELAQLECHNNVGTRPLADSCAEGHMMEKLLWLLYNKNFIGPSNL